MKEVILECKNIKKKYKKKNHYHIAANNVSLKLFKGEVLGIVGESGSGKSTLARIIMNLENPDYGEVIFENENITNIKKNRIKRIYKEMQMVFQNAKGSFNPKMTIGQSIEEYVCSLCSKSKEERIRYVEELLELVSLPKEFKYRYPHEISGGQCQRAAIARAVASHPKILVFDEATSALDVSIQAQVMELLIDMKKKFNISYIFICHDLALVNNFCDRVVVMKDGSIVEEGNTKEVISNPRNEYTQELLSYIKNTTDI